MEHTRVLFRAVIILVILLTIFDPTHSICTFVGWNYQVVKCPQHFPFEAYQELKQATSRLGRSSYLAVCCTDQQSQQKARESITQCRTSDCLPQYLAGYNNSCAHLKPVYMDNKLFSPDYEEVLRESCYSGVVSGVCCPRNTYSALHMTTSSAEINEFPHMVALPEMGCGGTVYNREFVLTAAHCVTGSNGLVQNLRENPMQVRIGTNMASKEAFWNVYPVAEILVHERYSHLRTHPEFGGFRIYNDIALLRLEKMIDFDKLPNIRPLELAPEGFRAEDYADNVVIAGWGTSELLSTTEHLQKSHLKIRSDSECFDIRKGKLGRRQYAVLDQAKQLLCLGGMIGDSISNEAGRGDSGGPAICRSDKGYAVLCGITSFGSSYPEQACVDNQNEVFCQPSVYVDVGYFRKWIEQRAGGQEERFLFRPALFGEEVKEDEYVHQVHVKAGDGKECGGTLVSEDTVVLAAHCVVDDEGESKHPVFVEMVKDLNEKVELGKRIRAISVSCPATFGRYENLNALNKTKAKNRLVIKDLAYKDNIAVLKLEKKVDIPKDKLPRLPEQEDFIPGQALELAFPTNTKFGDKLRKREFNILEQEECKRRLNRFKVIKVSADFDTSKVMCGVERYSGGGLCDRELGGGLMCKGKGKKFNVFCGIQTFRLCETTLPSAFFNVGKQVKLIEKFMAMK